MTRPMRVLYLEPSALVTGGAIALLRLVEALDKRIFRPLVVLGSDGPLVSRFRRIPGCHVLCRPLPSGLSGVTRHRVVTGALANLGSSIGYSLALRAIADRWHADIVHSNGLKMHVLSALTRRRSRRLLVWHIRDVLAPSYMPARGAALVRALVRRVPDVTICISETTRAAFGSAAPPALQLVFDGIQCPPAATRPPRLCNRRVLLLGRIAAWKGQEVFIRAVERLRNNDHDTEFIIAGGATSAADVEYERRLREAVEAAGLADRVVFAGVVTDIGQLLSGVDIVVHCSTSPEPFGLVIIEAMAAAVPVVATNLGGPAEMIDDGFSGRLYPPGDDYALAGILRELLADGALRRRLGDEGRRTVEARFGIERTVNAITSIYGQRWNGSGTC